MAGALAKRCHGPFPSLRLLEGGRQTCAKLFPSKALEVQMRLPVLQQTKNISGKKGIQLETSQIAN